MYLARLLLLAWLPALPAGSAPVPADDEAEIRALTERFCESVVQGNLDFLDTVFDPDPTNVYYDINEGPLLGLDRLKRVWRAAVRNGRLAAFGFGDDLQIRVEGDRALQTGSWTQRQVQQDGTTREISGRATILWRRLGDGWKVYHYHGSVTPRRLAGRGE
jgi:ketosteroid isomerase-like protein